MSVTHRPVPDDFRGVWVRATLQTDTDAEALPPPDDQTWARRMQTSSWHAQLQVPQLALQDRVARPLAELDAAQLAALAVQKGSVGITQFESLPEGPICTWLRRADYQPPGLQPDAGWMMFDQPQRLIEVGVHESYHEVWELLPDSTGRFAVLGALSDQQQDTGARILLAGRYMMQVRPRAQRWPRGMTPGYSLSDVLLHSPQDAVDWLDCEVSFGQLRDGHWHIERSTLPEREGQVCPWQAHRVDEHAALVSQGGAPLTWRVLEWSCDGDTLRD